MPDDAKLCWITREQRDALIEGLGGVDPAWPSWDPAHIATAFDAAPVPVERRRCTEEGHGSAVAGEDDDASFDYCPVAQTWLHFRPWETLEPCRFVSVFEVPACPSDATSETTT